jgi:hypothetical protein
LHIIYRAGIWGVFLIGFLLYSLGRMALDFYRMRSLVGGLLVSVLVYWFTLSNFFVILELPYNAVIVWSLFGIIWAYRDRLRSGDAPAL